LVVFRKACATECDAVAIGGGAAAEDCTWRTRRSGGRQRLQPLFVQRRRTARRGRVRERGDAADHRRDRDIPQLTDRKPRACFSSSCLVPRVSKSLLNLPTAPSIPK